MKTILLAKSSSGNPYSITFEQINGTLRVHCDCKAGVLQQQCKHRRALIAGDVTMLFDEAQISELQSILTSDAAKQLSLAVSNCESELERLEKEKSRLNAQEKAVKRSIGALLSGGLNPSSAK